MKGYGTWVEWILTTEIQNTRWYTSLSVTCPPRRSHVTAHVHLVWAKQSLNRPRQALGVPGSCDSQIYRQSDHEGGKVVNPKHRPPVHPRKHSWHYSFLFENESIQGQKWGRKYCQWEIPMTPWGIEPTAFRLVAQCPTNDHHLLCTKIIKKWDYTSIPP
jgi:hypothetical protein